MKAAALIASLLLVACGSRDAPARQPAFRPPIAVAGPRPTALAVLTPGDRADGPIRSVAGTDLRLTPFRVIGDRGLSKSQCGALIEGQRVMTLGAGNLDAYTCLRLVELRAMPKAESTARVALMYDAASANTRFRTAALLVRNTGGQWAVDADATAVFDDLPVKSWAALAGVRK